MQRNALRLSVIAAMTLVPLTFSCGKKKDKDSDDTATESASNPTMAYPTGLNLSVFPTATTTSLNLTDESGVDRTAAQKNEEMEKILSGQAESCLPTIHQKEFKGPDNETCYEFDQDLVYGGRSPQGTTTVSTFLGTKNGKNAKGEACFPAFTRAQVKDVIALMDQTLGFVGAGICQYKKDNAGAELPQNANESIDISKSLKDVFKDGIGNVEKAEIKRLADNEGRPVYMTKIDIRDRNGLTRSMRLLHSPDADPAKKIYNGTIGLIMNGDVRDKEPKIGPADKHRVMSVTYARTSDTAIKMELRTAQVQKDLVGSALDKAFVLDFNVGAKFTAAANTADYGKYYKADGTAFTQANEAVDGSTYIAFDMNKDTGEGTMSYWKNPGGTYYENARGFNISVAKNAAGTLEGCAISGAASTDFGNGTSIRRFLKEGGSLTLQAKGFLHPFFNSNPGGGAVVTGPTAEGSESFYAWTKATPVEGAKWYVPATSNATLATKFVTDQSGSLISRQCFKQNASGVYEIDTSKTTDTAGFELLDSGVAANNAKFIPPPSIGDAKPLPVDGKTAAAQ